MSKKLKICFIPKNTNKFICIFCNEFTCATAVPVSAHMKKVHLGVEAKTLEDLFSLLVTKQGLTVENKFCRHCSSPNPFRSLIAGYNTFCSHSCAVNDKDLMHVRAASTKRALLEKYGVENPSRIPGFSAMVKQTKLERYGDEKYCNSAQSHETMEKRYGGYYINTPEYKAKVKETSIKNHGVEHFTKSDLVKEKVRTTCLTRYGVASFLSTPGITRRVKGDGFPPEAYETLKLKFEERLQNHSELFDNVHLLNPQTRTFQCCNCLKEFVMDKVGLAKSNPRLYPHCETCFPIKSNKLSLFHQEVLGWLRQCFPELVIEQNKRICDVTSESDDLQSTNLNKEIDLYFPEKKLGIELNGLIWHSELFGNKHKTYHQEKTEACEALGVRLIHVFSDEWDMKKEIVKSKLLYLLGGAGNLPVVHARKCSLEITTGSLTPRVVDFLQKNHIQGGEFLFGLSNVVTVSAYNKESQELVGVMVFASTARTALNVKSKSLNEYELIRFSSCNKTRAPGLASRMFLNFIKMYSPLRITSYADRRWSSNKAETVYHKLGFRLFSITAPGYFYLLNNEGYKKRHHRFGFRKSMLAKKLALFSYQKTEWENMIINKHDRVWDSGMLKFVWESHYGY